MKLSERKASSFREKSTDELRQAILELKQEALNLRFQYANKEVQDSSRMLYVRRQIAQLNTLLNEKKTVQLKGGANA